MPSLEWAALKHTCFVCGHSWKSWKKSPRKCPGCQTVRWLDGMTERDRKKRARGMALRKQAHDRMKARREKEPQ